MIVLQENTHRLTESDFRFDVAKWRPLRHFTQKSEHYKRLTGT